MANYYCTARTNYFKVKDETAFKAWAASHGFQVAESELGKGFALFAGEANDSGDLSYFDEAQDETVHAADEISQFLARDAVAVFMEAGSEKARYVIGIALAVNAEGEQITISLNDIYAEAEKRFGIAPSRAEY
ncbi:MAG: hypothetical protein PHE83_19110 [Opitutaceae bacterium]|nr:hypothetical protein [Opitutaceae bacterium]